MIARTDAAVLSDTAMRGPVGQRITSSLRGGSAVERDFDGKRQDLPPAPSADAIQSVSGAREASALHDARAPREPRVSTREAGEQTCGKSIPGCVGPSDDEGRLRDAGAG